MDKRVYIIPLIFLLLMPIVALSSDVKTVDKQYFKNREKISWLDDALLNMGSGLFAMVNGYLCEDYPSIAKTCDSYNCQVYCPNDVTGGCEAVIWEDGYGTGYYKVQLDPGTSHWLECATCGEGNAVWEGYFCEEDCTCTDWESQGCGAGPCDSDQDYRTRDCAESCSDEEVCVYMSECESTTCQSQSYKQCYNGDVYWYDSCDQRGSIYDSCSSDEQCQNAQCVIDCTAHAYKQCYNGDVYWYDSCDNRGSIYESCSDNEQCQNTQCETIASDLSVTDAQLTGNEIEGNTVSVEYSIVNNGGSGSGRVACGIYSSEHSGTLFDIFGNELLAITTSSDCCSSDEFSSASGTFKISSGETRTGVLELTIPDSDSVLSCGEMEGTSNYNANGDYVLVCGPIDECFQGFTGDRVENTLTISSDSSGNGGDDDDDTPTGNIIVNNPIISAIIFAGIIIGLIYWKG